MKYSLTCLLVTTQMFSMAQSSPALQPSSLGIHFIYDVMENPVNNAGQSYSSGVAGLALNFQKGLSKHINFNTSLSGSILDEVNREDVDLGGQSKQLLLELDMSVKYSPLVNNHVVLPYAALGFGVSSYPGYFSEYVPIGIGFQINVTHSTFILLDAQKRFVLNNLSDNHYYFSIGLAGYIGKSKKPKMSTITHAPPAPLTDIDGDGILDMNDSCPTVPGVLRYHGCPIPDRDKDGINDEEDKCPDVPGVLRYQGCPIPDRDKDGINDEIDKCPDIPGVPEYNGCPVPVSVITSEMTDVINRAAENCFFESGKYELLKKSFKSLDEVVALLKSDTTLLLQINGYTDNRGNTHNNQILSENRAKSVLDYLLSKGISARRLHSKGYGQDMPVESNLTIDGRAKNRRVEMIISKK